MQECKAGTFAGGSWTSSKFPLSPGCRFRVTRLFTDADGHVHNPGEEWILLGMRFSKFDDELVLGVSKGDMEEWAVPMLWKPDKQQHIIENVAAFVEALP